MPEKSVALMRILTGFIGFVLAPCLGAQTLRVDGSGDRSALVVTATAEAEALPDRAILRISIESQARSGAEAGANTARIHASVLDTLKAFGFRAAGVASVNHGVSSFQAPGPRLAYDSATGRPTTYVGRSSIRITITRLAQLGEIASAVIAKGATGVVTVYSSTLADSARQAAVIEATRKARADAAAIAQSLGGSLGKLIELTSNMPGESRFRQGQPSTYEWSSAQLQRPPGSTPGSLPTIVIPGEIVFTAHVTGRWEFIPNP